MTKKQRERLRYASTERDAFLQGYAAALAQLDRLFDQPTMVASVVEGDGLTVTMLRAAGASRRDVARIALAVCGRVLGGEHN